MLSKEIYKRIKIAGLISFVPLALAVGPLAGYVTGDYLVRKAGWPPYVLFVCIGVGFLTSLFEVVRIIKLLLQIEEGPADG